MKRVVHSSVAGSVANPHVLVDGPKWDADHTLLGLDVFDSVAELQAALISSDVNSVELRGYYSAGDGGRHLRMRVAVDGDVTSADGAKWAIAEEIKNPRMYGWKGDGLDTHDDAPALRACAAATPDGGKMRLPFGIPYYNSVDGNNAVLTLTDKAINIEGDGWDFTTGGALLTPSGALFRLGPGIPDNADAILLKGTRAITGMQMSDFAILPAGYVWGEGHGRDAIRIDATGQDGFGHDSLNIRRLFIGNMKTGYSIHTLASSSNGGGALANSKISDCHFRNARFENVGDSVTIENPMVGANGTNDVRNLGIYFYSTPGATNFRVINGNDVAFNGMIVCDGGIAPMIDGLEMEQSAGFANTRLAMIDMNGGVSQVVSPTIVNCELGQNSITGTRPTGIRFNNTDGGSVTNTRIALVDGAAHHITQTALSLNLYVDHESNDYYIAGSRVTADIIASPQPSLNSRPPLLNVLPTGTAYATAATANTVAVRDGSGNLAAVGLTATAQIKVTLNGGGPGAGFLVSGANAALCLQNPSAAANEKNWDFLAQVGGQGLEARRVSDDGLSGTIWLQAFPGVGTAVSGVVITPPLTVTGTITNSALTASSAVATDASKNLVSVTNTGSGSNVLGITPTIATPVLNGLPTGTGVATANTVSTLVARDGSGNFSAGTITASLTGHASLDLATSALGTGVQTALGVNIGSAGAFTTFNGAHGTPSSIVLTNATGTAASLTAGNVTTNANLTGDVTSVGNATTLTNAPVIAKVLTGYTSGAGTVSSADSILSAIQKLNGNDATNANLTGVITSVGNATSLGSFTSANLAAALTDETGTGANVFGTSPTITTPNIVGTATNDNAAAGSVGEYSESVVLIGSQVALTSATAKTVTSITLAAGDWRLSGTVSISPAATTSITQTAASFSTTTNTVDTTPGRFSQHVFAAVVTAGFVLTEPIGSYRFSLSGSTTIFLVAQSTFTVSTNNAYGIISATRVR